MTGVGAVPADEPTAQNFKIAKDQRDIFVNRWGAAEAELIELRASLADACIHHYENDQHYDHEGPHEPPSWREVVQLRGRLAAITELHFERKGICWECNRDWPCATASVLGVPGEQ